MSSEFEASLKPLTEEIGEFALRCVLSPSDEDGQSCLPCAITFVQNGRKSFIRVQAVVPNGVASEVIKLPAPESDALIQALEGIVAARLDERVFTGGMKVSVDVTDGRRFELKNMSVDRALPIAGIVRSLRDMAARGCTLATISTRLGVLRQYF